MNGHIIKASLERERNYISWSRRRRRTTGIPNCRPCLLLLVEWHHEHNLLTIVFIMKSWLDDSLQFLTIIILLWSLWEGHPSRETNCQFIACDSCLSRSQWEFGFVMAGNKHLASSLAIIVTWKLVRVPRAIKINNTFLVIIVTGTERFFCRKRSEVRRMQLKNLANIAKDCSCRVSITTAKERQTTRAFNRWQHISLFWKKNQRVPIVSCESANSFGPSLFCFFSVLMRQYCHCLCGNTAYTFPKRQHRLRCVQRKVLSRCLQESGGFSLSFYSFEDMDWGFA